MQKTANIVNFRHLLRNKLKITLYNRIKEKDIAISCAIKSSRLIVIFQITRFRTQTHKKIDRMYIRNIQWRTECEHLV